MALHQNAITRATFFLVLAHVASSTSSSSSRPPMSLSSIINDLEAEGVSRGISTATIVGSKTLSLESRSSLLKRIIGCGLSGEERTHALEEVGDDITSVGRVQDGIGLALAIASSPTEASSTIRACGKSLVFIASELDLHREEGLFDTLAPAVETIINYPKDETSSGGKATLVVVLPCRKEENVKFARMCSQFENAASAMLATLVVEGDSNEKSATSVDDIFDRVVYLTDDSLGEESVVELLEALCPSDSEELSLREPSDALSAVAAAVPFTLDSLFMMDEDARFRELPPVEVALARKLLPVQRSALRDGLATVTDLTSDGERFNLVSNFGELCSAAINKARETFDAASGRELQSSPLVKSKRIELLEELTSELETLYEKQLAELKVAMFEKFRKSLSGLRVSPNLDRDMDEVRKTSIKEFDSAAGKLQIPGGSVSSAAKASFRKSVTEYCTDRLQAARASGQYRPSPRKAMTVGLHWLLPQPFGSDYRQAEIDRKNIRNYVYHPKDGLSEVNPDDVRSGAGEWKSRIVPSPQGNDIVYQQARQNDED